MAIHRFRMIGLGVLYLATVPTLLAADASPPSRSDDVQALAVKIDELIAARWAGKEVKPAAPADDAEFLRRVYLDLAGRIPRVSDARAFLADRTPDKRQRLVQRLLNGPNYVNHFTNVWRAQILPPSNNQQLQFLLPSFEVWLRSRIRDNVPYDQMVRELLTVPVAFGNGRAVRQPFNQGAEPTPIAYYQANEFKPENLAASTSRMFLGVKLECAQCHNHPFANWSRKQFWEYAAFFAGIQSQGGNVVGGQERAAVRELKIAGTDQVVQARFLDGTNPQWGSNANTRATLAEWMTRGVNPFFARAAANRLWAHFFGIGLLEPIDEPGDDNPPSHPELLDEMARQFAAHQFDVKFLIEAIMASKTYQRSSVAAGAEPSDPRLFAQMALKGLTAEQLYDSISEATGLREQPATNQRFFNPTARGDFLAKFASQDKRTEQQTSILQALALMNGKYIADATSLDRSEVLAAVLDAPFLDTAQRLETLYLATLTRLPRPAESERFVKYVQSGGPRGDARAALTDVFWVLLNSSEFILNH